MAAQVRAIIQGVILFMLEGNVGGGGGGGGVPDPCSIGTLDFSQACQSGQIVTVGL